MTDGGLPWDSRTTLLAAAGAFAAGVQTRLLLDAGLGSYPPPGAAGVAWSTLLLLAGVLMVAASRTRPRAALPRLSQAVTRAAAEATRAAEAWTSTDAAPGGPAAEPEAGAEPRARQEAPAARLDVALETPFDEAPAVAPGEDVPVRVRVDAAGLDGDARLRLAVREGGSRRVRTADMDGGSLVRSVRFTEPGPVEVAATVDHPRAEAATARAHGRCQAYREAVGDLVDDLREAADARGLGAGPGSTPRQTCRAFPAGPTDALRDALEAALYGDDRVRRENYLRIHRLGEQVLAAHEEEIP